MSIGILRSEILPRLHRVRPDTGGYRASCPVPGHGKRQGDRNASFTISVGDTQPIVYKCFAGCEQDAIKEALISLGVNWEAVSAAKAAKATDDDTWIACGWDRDAKRYDGRHRKVAEYEYRDERGALVYAVARCALKGRGCEGFRQWRPDPSTRGGRKWSRLLPEGGRVGDGLPYRLPEIVRAADRGDTIWICEGEADCDRLAAAGFAATCNAEGAGKWTPAHAAWLKGANVVIVADRDPVGWGHAQVVANTLLDVAESIEIVRAASGKDARDHLDAGRPIAAFVTVAQPLAPRTPDLAVAA